MSNKNKRKNVGQDNNITEEKLIISSIKSFSYSPRKTRRQVKIEYDDSKIKNEILNSDESVAIPTTPSTLKDQNLPDTSSKSRTNLLKEEQTKTKPDKVLKWEPLHWKQVLENLKTMRSSSSAPVDTMGCDKCSDVKADVKTQRFHTLVALMLSSQTKDQVTYDAMNRLKKNNLTPKTITDMDVSHLEQLLNPVSFYKNKSKYLKKTAEILVLKYNSDIPNTFEELIKLPGVGPKMAHICMNSAWNIVSGIGVDTHVHRISNRLGWVKKKTKTPEDTRKELESWLPFEHWMEINHLMVGFGQTVCTPVSPKCDICLNNLICPAASSTTKNSIKKKFTKEKN